MDRTLDASMHNRPVSASLAPGQTTPPSLVSSDPLSDANHPPSPLSISSSPSSHPAPPSHDSVSPPPRSVSPSPPPAPRRSARTRHQVDCYGQWSSSADASLLVVNETKTWKQVQCSPHGE